MIGKSGPGTGPTRPYWTQGWPRDRLGPDRVARPFSPFENEKGSYKRVSSNVWRHFGGDFDMFDVKDWHKVTLFSCPLCIFAKPPRLIAPYALDRVHPHR